VLWAARFDLELITKKYTMELVCGHHLGEGNPLCYSLQHHAQALAGYDAMVDVN
jgi:hypothetical protein